jgi:transposase
MRQVRKGLTNGPDKAPAEQVLKDIWRQTRRQYSAEETIRIVLVERA